MAFTDPSFPCRAFDDDPIGRAGEVRCAAAFLERAAMAPGGRLLILGERGTGRTALIEYIGRLATHRGVELLSLDDVDPRTSAPDPALTVVASTDHARRAPLWLRSMRPETILLRPLDAGMVREAVARHTATPPCDLQDLVHYAAGRPGLAVRLARVMLSTPRRERPWMPPPAADWQAPAVPDDSVSCAVLERLAVVGDGADPLRWLSCDGAIATSIRGLVARGVLRRRRGRLSFADPHDRLLVYDRLDPERRRALHAQAALARPSSGEYLIHRALAAPGPSAALADELALAAHRARLAGRLATAWRLAELAVQLTPPQLPERLDARMRGVAMALHEAGACGEARGVLEQLEAGAHRTSEVAAARLLMAQLHSGGHVERAAILGRALSGSGGRVQIQAHALADLAWESALGAGDLASAQASVRAAQALALASRRRDLQHDVCIVQAVIEDLGGTASRPEPLARCSYGAVRSRARCTRARLLLWRGHLRAALQLLAALEASEPGPVVRMEILMLRAEAELRRGCWEQADAALSDALLLPDATGPPREIRAGAVLRRLIAAHRGQSLVCSEDDSLELVAQAREDADLGVWLRFRWAAGLCELSGGHIDTAVACLAPALERLHAAGIANPGAFPLWLDAGEALLEAGELEAYTSLAAPILAVAERSGAAAWRGSALRWRGLEALAAGDPQLAVERFAAGLEPLHRCGLRFDLARTMFLLGRGLRRRGRRREALVVLDRAVTDFLRLGAIPWARRCADERERTVTRRGPRGGLTRAERKVAALAAQGRTDRQIALALGTSQSTVHTQLKCVFAKLGIHSRTQLIARAAEWS